MGKIWASFVASVCLLLGLLAGILQAIVLVIASPILVLLIFCLRKYLNSKGVSSPT